MRLRNPENRVRGESGHAVVDHSTMEWTNIATILEPFSTENMEIKVS